MLLHSVSLQMKSVSLISVVHSK